MSIALTTTFDADFRMLPSALDNDEFAQWVRLLERRVGLRENVVRKSFLVQCVETRMRKRGIGTRKAYLDLLSAARNNEEEWDALIELLPLHETRFARHESSLRLVGEFIAKRVVASPETPGHITLWSVGCSTGEEVYTLAIAAHEALKDHPGHVRLNVIGSDLCNNSLAAARRGVYHRRQLGGLTPSQLATWFDKTDDELYSVNPQLRGETQFVPVNLANSESDMGHVGMVDVVFCQNVLIYFDNESRERVCNRLAEHLLPGGLMVLGAGELVRWNNPRMKRTGGDGTLAYAMRAPGTEA